MNTSVDDKGSLWWAGSWIWGVLTLCAVLSLTGVVDLFDFRIYVALLLFGILLSMGFGMSWARGDLPPKRPKPITMRFKEDVPYAPGMYAMEFIDVPKQKMGPRVTERALGPVRFDLWWIFHRFPVLIGDKLLSLIWTGLFTGVPGVGGLRGLSGFARAGTVMTEAPTAVTAEVAYEDDKYGGDFSSGPSTAPTMVGGVPLDQVPKPTENAF